jgi:hypothetical protein
MVGAVATVTATASWCKPSGQRRHPENDKADRWPMRTYAPHEHSRIETGISARGSLGFWTALRNAESR